MRYKGASIIICCHNSSSVIEETLKHIAKQNTGEISCEIVLIDNASSDNTAEVAKATWFKTGNDSIKFKLAYEQTAGLIFARKKGVYEAKYEYLIFCDDDNWLDENYLQKTCELFKSNPQVAIMGGFGIAEFEDVRMKPIWFDDFYHGYAVGPQAAQEQILHRVYGAGMAVRKSVLEKIMEEPVFLSGRKKNLLSSGEDGEICFRAMIAGYKILYSPELKFKHFLTKQRLSWDYLKKLHVGLSKANVVMDLYDRAINSKSRELPPFYWLKKALYYWGIYLKYWPKHYLSYRKGEGTIEEIHHITWKNIALNYLEYNFKTIAIYRKIMALNHNSAKFRNG